MKAIHWLFLLVILASCAEISQEQIRNVDSLNQQAYRIRYSDIDSTCHLAQRAYHDAGNYSDGKARALNILGYVDYQQMDFASAFSKLDSVSILTNNQIILLSSDVMRMKINQRIGQGSAFFEARVNAQKRMKRALEEYDQLSDIDKQDLFYATTEYHIISSTYWYYQDQEQQAIAEMDAIADDFTVVSDTTQWLYYHYMMGSGGLIEGPNEEVSVKEFDHLMICYGYSRSGGVTYFEANSLQALASLLSDTVTHHLIQRQKPDLYHLLLTQHEGWLPQDTLDIDTHLPEALAMHAVYAFRQYKDLFQTACAYRTLGEMAFKHGQYELALEDYSMALDCVNEQYYYNNESTLLQSNEPVRLLSLYDEGDNGLADIELNWIDSDSIYTVPEWIAGIRQQISMAFSALGMMKESDFNRNIYLDIIARTSQNVEMESRREQLLSEADSLRFRLMLTFFLFVAMVGLIVYYAQKLHKNNELQLNSLKTGQSDNHYVNEHDYAHLQNLLETSDEIQEQVHLFTQKLDTNKRRNAEKRAKVSLVHAVTPFLDRIINQNERMTKDGVADEEKLSYIIELTDRIVTYNEILTDWIKMEKGELAMQISTVKLDKIFQTLQRGHYAYDQKGVTLNVLDTDLVVKADEALTLFMLNTLADNARKFTSESGSVTVKADGYEDYVELSVVDTGCGMSAEDVDTLNNNKVYDSRKIGNSKEGKGFGFGIMNCRGIIEKYRKTSNFFQVCCFGVESELGKGSRFYFRLPRVLVILSFFFCTMVSLAQTADNTLYQPDNQSEHVKIIEDALSRLKSINPDLQLYYENDSTSDTSITEIDLFLNGDSLNYPLAIRLRNEIARAALALNEWDIYQYNNHICTTLYKLYHQDRNLPTYCEKLQQTQTTSRQLLVLLVLFSVLVIVLCLVLLRRRMYLGKGLKLQQQLCNDLQNIDTDIVAIEINDLLKVTHSILHLCFEGMNNWQHIDGMKLQLFTGDQTLLFDVSEGDCQGEEHVISLKHSIGQLYLYGPTSNDNESINQQVYYTLSNVLFSRVCQIALTLNDIELKNDELNHLKYEEHRLHVQNQVLDNCLSTIKHESMYYPARIQQLAQRIVENKCNANFLADNLYDDMEQLNELSHYYKDVYTLLSSQAEKLTSQTYYRKEKVALTPILDYCKRHFNRLAAKQHVSCQLDVTSHSSYMISADNVLMEELMTRFNMFILKRYAELPENPDLYHPAISVEQQGNMLKINYNLPSIIFDENKAHSLFYPESGHVNLLIAKQIIRELDTLNNYPGLRLIADAGVDYSNIWFTVSSAPSTIN